MKIMCPNDFEIIDTIKRMSQEDHDFEVVDEERSEQLTQDFYNSNLADFNTVPKNL